jgi:hypothetical protein
MLAAHCIIPLAFGGWKSLALAFACFILAVQLTIIFTAAANGFDQIFDYYEKLCVARSSESRHVREYVESYRHMREHGNAFFIVFLELGLAMAAIAVPSLAMLSALIVVWVLPACVVWILGTVLESKLPQVSQNQN